MRERSERGEFSVFWGVGTGFGVDWVDGSRWGGVGEVVSKLGRFVGRWVVWRSFGGGFGGVNGGVNGVSLGGLGRRFRSVA